VEGGEKIKKESNGNIVRKRGNGKEDGNYGIRVLGHDDLPDFRRIKFIGPDHGVRIIGVSTHSYFH